MKSRLKPLCATVAGALVLAGCGSAGQIFGLERNPPDEFAVMSRAPLTLPPDFNLRPPAPGAPRPQEGTAPQRGQSALFGGTPGGFGFDQGVSRGESVLLAQSGAANANPEIRQIVNREATDLLVADQGFIDRLLFWREPEEPGVVVDAEAEAQRLQANAALGEPLTEGDVPVIERRRRAPLEGLLDFF